MPRSAGLREIDDASLVALLVQRNPLAQRIAWQRLGPMVRSMLTRVFGQAAEVDDLVQDTFLALFMRVHELRDPRALKAYVMSITEGGIRYALRRKAVARARYVPEDTDVIAAPSDVDARQALDRLQWILQRMNAVDRAAFILRFVEGRELAAISLALGLSVATIKRRIARAWTRVIVHSRADAALVAYVAQDLRSRHS